MTRKLNLENNWISFPEIGLAHDPEDGNYGEISG